MDSSIDADNVQLRVILQHGYIFKRIAVNKNTIAIISWLNLAKLMSAHHLCCNAARRSNDGFVWREVHQFHEMLKVAGIRSMRCPGEAIVA